MENIFNNAISNELFFVYTLIILVIILIIVIIILDKKESKKENKSLFDTLNMKIISDSYKQDSDDKNKIIQIKQEEHNDDFKDLEPINAVKMIDSNNYLRDAIDEIKDELYQEQDLDKTQAQIRVEEITKALQQECKNQEISEDKYQKFEEEQEQNAIISYNELKESFDRLYNENEKIQYLDDNEIPININELYDLRDNKSKIKSDDFKTVDLPKETPTSSFKSSPLISPVYGIQTPPVDNTINSKDNDIENANLFLKNLKELKNNLE